MKRAGSTTLGGPDWTVRLNACTVHNLPAPIMQFRVGWDKRPTNAQFLNFDEILFYSNPFERRNK